MRLIESAAIGAHFIAGRHTARACGRPTPMDKPSTRALVWFRRDLRVDDHAALYHALRAARQVWCAFVFDRDILDPLPRADRRVEFIREAWSSSTPQLRALGGATARRRAPDRAPRPRRATRSSRLAAALHVQAVYANHDDDPAALRARRRGCAARWPTSASPCTPQGPRDVRAQRGADRKRQALQRLHALQERLAEEARRLLPARPTRSSGMPAALAAAAGRRATARVPALAALGFEPTNLQRCRSTAGSAGAPRRCSPTSSRRIDALRRRRATSRRVKGPSYLGVHLRFGTMSIRAAGARGARAHARPERRAAPRPGCRSWSGATSTTRSCTTIPHVVGAQLQARVRPHPLGARQATPTTRFAAWCEGRTGYPLVDAAMAQINQTGYMHNRLRMVAASFLCKDLGIDWRRGERYFAAAPERLRPGVQQRRLAVGGLDRLRRPAVVPHLQPGDAERAVRPRGQLHPPLPAAAGARCRRRADPRAVDGAADRARGGRRRARAATTRGRSSTTPRRARRRCSATRWSSAARGAAPRRLRPPAQAVGRGARCSGAISASRSSSE